MSMALAGFRGVLVVQGAGLERVRRGDELAVVGLRC